MEERKRIWLVVFFASAMALTLFVSLQHSRVRAGGITPAGMRVAAPHFVLTRLNGSSWRLQDHQGQVVLINLWASWCGPCREEIPGLVRLFRKDGPKGLEVVGLSLDVGDRQKVMAFAKQFQVPYPIVLPEPMSQLADTVESVPTTILVDRDGRVAKTYVGAVQGAVFAADVEELLAEKDVVR
jgi:thiol-disulfide isomerase/thioredoxin